MSINVIDALVEITKAPQWAKKLAIVSSVMLLGFVFYILGVWELDSHRYFSSIILFAIGLIGLLYSAGYVVSSINKTMNSDSFVLGEVKEKNLILKGLHYGLSCFVYALVLTVAIVLLTILLTLMFTYLQNNIPSLNTFFVIVSFALCIPIILYVAILVAIALTCYFKNLKIKDLLSFHKHFKILAENHKTCWIMFLHQFIYAILFNTIGSILVATIVGIILCPFVYYFAMIWSFNISAQFAKEIQIEKYL